VQTLPFHPLDVVGWDGCLYPYVFNVADYEPITGRVHQPPPCSPGVRGIRIRDLQLRATQGGRPPALYPGAVLPTNVDSDEIMFYVDGDYEARKGSGIGRGRSRSTRVDTRTVRSQVRRRGRSVRTTSTALAVMVDTFRPHELGEGGRAVDDGAYAWSWSGGRTGSSR